MNLTVLVKRILKQERRIKVIILGLDNAGKTTLLRAYLGEEISHISPTFGYQIITKHVKIKGEECILEILDMGGQSSIRAYWDTYYAGADGVIFVYDNGGSTDYMAVLEATVSHPTLANSSFICAANKSDLVGEELDKTVDVSVFPVEQAVGFDFITEINKLKVSQNLGVSKSKESRVIPIVHTSAKSGKNVVRLFTTLLETIFEKSAENGIL
ncbi:ADP-ribosylation factor-like protein 2 [Nematocida homosporus]|uniref:ADP-ribosylation factor-like protein 2 n=1 Tax=Nematocida homosporus TaxID=1912981 RepID=UPI00221E9C7B|nr:ADP-ribosylation factor-like protein 2 [Nematocida homosporus]KAI5185719.1 ADP-ribosylation factor-like protein 2 [Nematocida homosporus]